MSDGGDGFIGGGKPAPGRRCPICRRPTSDDYRPFCSRRCADVDLGRWLSGGYVVPGGDSDADDDGNATSPDQKDGSDADD